MQAAKVFAWVYICISVGSLETLLLCTAMSTQILYWPILHLYSNRGNEY